MHFINFYIIQHFIGFVYNKIHHWFFGAECAD